MTCKHWKKCKGYENTSYTCTQRCDRDYCGKYREFEEKKKSKVNVFLFLLVGIFMIGLVSAVECGVTPTNGCTILTTPSFWNNTNLIWSNNLNIGKDLTIFNGSQIYLNKSRTWTLTNGTFKLIDSNLTFTNSSDSPQFTSVLNTNTLINISNSTLKGNNGLSFNILQILGNSSNLIIKGSIIDGLRRVIFNGDGNTKYFTIENNIFKNFRTTYLEVFDANNSLINNNSFYNVTNDGGTNNAIRLTRTNNVTIENNNINYSEGSVTGIYISTKSINTLVKNNVISNMAGACVATRDNSSFTFWINNTILNCGSYGIDNLEGATNVLVENNTITNATNNIAFSMNIFNTNYTSRNNRIYDSREYGLIFNTVGEGYSYNDYINNSAKRCLSITDGSDGIIINNLTCNYNTLDAIVVGNSNNVTLNDININNTILKSVYIADSSNVTLNNFSLGNIKTISVFNATKVYLNNTLENYYIVNNIHTTANSYLIVSTPNALIVYDNSTSIPVYGTNQEINLTLAPNQYVYVYTNTTTICDTLGNCTMNVTTPGAGFNYTYDEEANKNLTFMDNDANFLTKWYNWLVDGISKLAGYGENVFSYVFHLSASDNNATVNMLKYENYNTTICYQESANVSNQTGIDTSNCGLNYTGNYKNLTTNAFDGNWGTYQLMNSAGADYYINYTIPDNTLNAILLQEIGLSPTNFSIPNSCLYENKLQLKIHSQEISSSDRQHGYCYNSINWEEIWFSGNGYAFYEEAIYWNVTTFDTAENTTFLVIENISAPTITLAYPTSLIDYGKLNGTLQLNFTATDINLDKVWYNYNGTNVSVNGALSGIANLSNITLSTKKNVTIYANDTAGSLYSETFGWDYKVFENSRPFNTTTYETKNETFLINLTANSSLTNVYLNYNGVDYLTTKTGGVYSKTLPMELVATDTNRTFYYKFEYAGTNITSPTSIQLVKNYLVNWTGTKQYINITIKDEYDNTIINSTTMDTLFDYYIDMGGYTNIHQEIKVEDGIFGLNSTPNIDRWSGFGRLYYYATGYQPRYFFIDNDEVTNSTIKQQTLYLLLQTDGILARYKIYDNIGNELENVRISAYKKVGSSEILVEQVLTDSLGEASLFLNPNYYHRIVITYDDCTSIDRTRRITSSDTYTEFMTCGAVGGNSELNLTTFENVTSSFSPYSPVQYTNNTVTFSFTSSDSNCNLDETTYVLKFGGTNLISLTGNNPCGQTLSQSVNLENYSGTLIGYGIMKIGNSQVTLTKQYKVLNINNVLYNQTSVNSLLDKLKDPTFGLEIGFTPTTKAFICFLILFGLIASFGNLTNKDNIPIMLVLVCLFLFVCSYMNFLTVFNSEYDWLNQYGILFLMGIFSSGIIIRRYA